VSSATGTREVPEPRADVWRALAVLQPYCAVCDVSYVVTGTGRRTTFVAVSGRLDGEPPEGAPRGRILEWAPGRTVVTELELTPETWTTRIDLADTAEGGTRVTMTVTHRPRGSGRLSRRFLGRAARPMVERTVESELGRIPEHLAQLRGSA
jgi:hypothetical protein